MTIGDWINSIVALATAAMAFVTWRMAAYTRDLAKETNNGLEQAERHHQEALKPYCVIEFTNSDPSHPFGYDFNTKQTKQYGNARSPQPSFDSMTICIAGQLCNFGKGPAKDVYCYLNSRRGAGDQDVYPLTHKILASGMLGAESASPTVITIVSADVIHLDSPNGTKYVQSFDLVPNDTYEVVLEYRDVFGNVFRTVHPREIWETPTTVPHRTEEEIMRAMALHPNRPAPRFESGAEPYLTPADHQSGICTGHD